MDELIKIYPLIPPGLMRAQTADKCEDIDDMPIAMAYVPRQSWDEVYEKDKGFMRGTIFPKLDKPFKGAWHK